MNDVSNDRKNLLKGAFRALEEMQARLDAVEREHREPLAVVGLACRFPGAPDAQSYWRLLTEGGNAICEVPPGRWDIDAYYDADPSAEAKMYTRHGGFLDRVDGFDTAFFSIAPREAISMDPQQRLLLEVAWESLENAGVPVDRLFGTRTGVFLGICNNDYGQAVARRDPAGIDAYCGTGVAFSVAAGRLSYALGLQGPCMAVDTACSSSLVALDLACQNLRGRRCDVALVGGVNLLLNPEGSVYFCKVRALAPDGQCKTFDDSADGYGRAEGCGVVVLKRLSDARRDGDRIRAIVRGSAVNHDGRSNGLTAPNGLSQEAVIRAALEDAGLEPRDVSYVEAHGTGTPLGDPIELLALARAYGEGRGEAEKLLVGSAKANIGHLESAAGMAGLIKAVLALEQGEIPKQIHFSTPNRHVPWTELPLAVARERTAWKGARRFAGVSSFGFSGTNAHVVLEAPPAAATESACRPLEVMTVSGRSAEAVRTLAGLYADHLRAHGPAAAADMAFTANTGRVHFAHRAAIVGTPECLAGGLDDIARGGIQVHHAGATESGVAFLFTGQGSQYFGMARELDELEPVFRGVIDRCGDVFRAEFGHDLRALLWDGDDPERVDQTEFTQPALYAVQCGLAALWRSWGVVPAAAVGHSVGEFAAAQAAGVLSLEDGMHLVAARGRMMQDLGLGGAMAAVFATERRVMEALGEMPQGLAIAAVNAPNETVLSGAGDVLEGALETLRGHGISSHALNVSHGFHSPQLEPMLDAFEELAGSFRHAPPQICLVSNLTGEPLSAAPDGGYWRRHAREPVRFAEAVSVLAARHRIFLEIGPQPILLAMSRRSLEDEDRDRRWLPSLRRGVSSVQQMLESLAELHLCGVPVDWPAFAENRGQRMELPTYPFERQRYWLDDEAAVAAPIPVQPAAPAHAEAPASTGAAPGSFVAALLAMPVKDRLDHLIQRIQHEVQRVLRLGSPPGIDLGFFELGMDSLMAIEMRAVLESELGRELPSTLAFDHPNIGRLASFLLREIVPGEPKEPKTIRKADMREPVAVVGMGCRFPGGANDPQSFWRLLKEGRCAAVPVPPDRWQQAGWYDPDPDARNKSYCRMGNFLDGPVDRFDAPFFSITPREATGMDPQQRLLLEVAWEALENAGLAARRGDRGGVFVGINTNDYARLLGQDKQVQLDAYTFTGNTFSVAAGRISHVLGIEGPSLAVDTACSSSLVAVHLACQSLQAGECDFALAGGVNLMLAPDAFVALSRMRALAPDGRCKTFDASADGYGRGEGCGVVVLKRLSDARADGDDILAVIHGSAVNQDGASGGLTVPNGTAQQALIGEAVERAGALPTDIVYLEAHGTGTALGDPIEVTAAGQVLGAGRSSEQPLFLGSVKSNIGHLEAAAGIAGLIKVVLSLRHGIIPAYPHLTALNPQIAWDRLPVSVPREAVPWPAAEHKFAGVSSFGMSGTNAHVIVGGGLLEGGFDAVGDEAGESGGFVVPVSGRSSEAVAALAGRYGAFLSAGDRRARDLAYTAGAGRTHFEHRLAVVAPDRDGLCERLRLAGEGGSGPGLYRGTASASSRPRLAFLFTGQGSQYAGMARGLHAREPVFRAALDRCEEILRAELDAPLLSVLYGDDGGLIDQTAYTQPALFAVEYALSQLWRSWGIEPSVVLGHSVGQYVAACLAGVFSLEEGLRLLAIRARAMQALPPGGGMAAVRLSSERLMAELAAYEGRLWLAAENGAEDVVVSGEQEALSALCRHLDAQGIATQALRVSHAFHSGLMAPAAQALRQAAAAIDYKAPQLRLIRDMDGTLADGPLGADYWTQHLLQPVRFGAALKCLEAQACTAVLEIGPQPVLTALAQGGDERTLRLASLRRQRDDVQTMHESLAALYAAGFEVDWKGLHRPHQARKIQIPTYPFQRKQYWGPGDPAVDDDVVAEEIATPPATPFHEIRWQAVAGADDAAKGAEGWRTEGWLVFASRDRVGLDLTETLRARGLTCAVVRQVGDPGDADYRVDPAAPEAMDQLIRESLSTGACSAVAYLWALDAAACGDGRVDATDPASVLGPLHLVQSILSQASSDPPKLWFATRGAQPVDGGDVALCQAPLWGFGRVVALENPEIWGGLIDLDPQSGADEAARLAHQLCAMGEEDFVALRGGKCFVARVVASAAEPHFAKPQIRSDASYLVTGGLGSLGFAVARWLIEAGARDLILLGRRAPSPSLADEIAALADRGARIAVMNVDVADRDAIEQAVERIAQAHAPLRGVIHAAGVLDDGVVFAQTAERFTRVMTPKLCGGWNLHCATRRLDLDFFVLFSSAATLVGSPGQSNYVAANAFLDALAHHRRAQGLPAVSIGWGPWSDIGMAADLARREARAHVPNGVSPIDPGFGLELLGHLIAGGPAQVTAMPVDWAQFLSSFGATERPRALADIAGALGLDDGQGEAPKTRSVILERLTSAPAGERSEMLADFIQHELACVIGDEDGLPDPARGFFDMGLDSLMAVEMKNRLGAALQVSLPATLIFRFANVVALADHLSGEVLIFADPPQPAAPVEDADADDVDDTSEETLLALLAEELGHDAQMASGGAR